MSVATTVPPVPIDPSGLTARDGAWLAEVRSLAAEYDGADQTRRTEIRSQVDTLAQQLGLRSVDPDTLSRWAVLPDDVHAAVRRLSTPAITSSYAQHVYRLRADTFSERFRQIDYRVHLTDGNFNFMTDTEIAAKLRELAVGAEHGQNSAPRLPDYAGQLLHLPQDAIGRIARIDPQLAAQVAAEGVYVGLSGRVDLRAHAVPNTPSVELKAGVARYDLTTPAGRADLLLEDRARSDSVIRTAQPQDAAALLATNSAHYINDARIMYLASDALVAELARYAPTPEYVPAPSPAAATTGTHITVTADRVSVPTPDRGKSTPTFGRPTDPATGQPVPLFNGPPVREQVQQGYLGDCGIIATLGAVIGHRPELLGHLLQPNPDGSVDVVLHESTMPGGTTSATGRELRVTVQPEVPSFGASPTDSAFAKQLKVGSSWASTLEKALAAVDRTWSDARRNRWQNDYLKWTGQQAATDVGAPLGYGRLGTGSTPELWAELMTQLTGHPAHTSDFDRTLGAEPATEAWLAATIAAGNPVLVSTLSGNRYQGSPPFSLYANHAYEVVEVSNGEVRLRNPWNSNHPARIPIRQFLDVMAEGFAYLDARPAVPTGHQAHSLPVYAPTPVMAGAQAGAPVTADPYAASAGASPAIEGPRLPRGVGRVHLDEHTSWFAYYAVLAADAQPEGLSVVEMAGTGEPRTARWMVRPYALGLGGERPLTRVEAEHLAITVLGFTLPDEPTLHGMLGS